MNRTVDRLAKGCMVLAVLAILGAALLPEYWAAVAACTGLGLVIFTFYLGTV